MDKTSYVGEVIDALLIDSIISDSPDFNYLKKQLDGDTVPAMSDLEER